MRRRALRREAASIDAPPRTVEREATDNLNDVAAELLSAPDGRATHLLSLASQFDAFRAPMSDPAQWVSRLVSAPRSAHVRTSVVGGVQCLRAGPGAFAGGADGQASAVRCDGSSLRCAPEVGGLRGVARCGAVRVCPWVVTPLVFSP